MAWNTNSNLTTSLGVIAIKLPNTLIYAYLLITISSFITISMNTS